MSHEVESMMFLGETPWHGIGKEIQENNAYDIESCIKAAGLDWEVKLRQCAAYIAEESQFLNVPAFATTRCRSNGDHDVLGIVGERYEILQNIDAFKIFQPFLDTRMVRLNTAGSLFNGAKIWVLCEIMTEPLRITETDIVRKFLLLSSGHDGKTTVRFGYCPIRVVCNNTLVLAHENNLSKLIRARHTKNILTNLENIRDTINLINHDFDATLEQYQRLLRTDVNRSDVERYISIVLGIEDKELSTRQYNINQRILSHFYSSPGNEEKSVRGTAWCAYNALTYYFTHEYGRSPESRLDSLWLGSNNDLNRKALTVALIELTK
jgi:phage/plasmid-like protein (TIGR03299 family)